MSSEHKQSPKRRNSAGQWITRQMAELADVSSVADLLSMSACYLIVVAIAAGLAYLMGWLS